MPLHSVTLPEGRKLHLGYTYSANGAHPAGWRYPGAQYGRAFDPEFLVELARIAEGAQFDFVFFGDRLATAPEYQYINASVLARTEPFTTAAFIATLTSRIGLVVTANPTYFEPFNLARLTASLDHISKGRAAWNIVTGSDPRAAHNYSRAEHGDLDTRYDRADEFIALVRGLWDSWEDDAYVRDKETGEFVRAEKIHAVNHSGKVFNVKGPLNVARSPQGNPVIFHTGSSPRERAFAAREADVIIGDGTTMSEGIEFSNDVRRRASEYGRDTSQVFVLSRLTPIVGRSLEEARAVYDELNRLIVLDEDVRCGGIEPEGWLFGDTAPVPAERGSGYRNLGALSQRLGTDVTGESLDEVVSTEAASNFADPELQLSATARTGRRLGKDLTWRDLLYTFIVNDHVVVGGPKEVADYIEHWFVSGAVDGFSIQPAYLVHQLTEFVDLVIPELRQRGLFPDPTESSTLRQRFGLERPASQFALVSSKEKVS